MNRAPWIAMLAAAAVATGCVVVPARPPPEPTYTPPPAYVPPPAAYQPAPAPAPVVLEAPPPVPRVQVWYYGEHFVPDRFGGGWCYEDGPHVHDYYPDQPNVYVVDRGYYTYRGPFVFSYYEGHPLPGGGWCMIRGPHTHEYAPPRSPDFYYTRERGYVYRGPYHANRPPPAAYWPVRPMVRPAPVAPAPAPATRVDPWRPGGPVAAPMPASQPVPHVPERGGGYQPPPPPPPAPAPQPWQGPGHRDDAPGHGNLPPGRGGTPPGQVNPPAPTSPPVQPPPTAAQPWQGPGHRDDAPGHGNLPPGRGGTPPGHQPAAQPAAQPAQQPQQQPPGQRLLPRKEDRRDDKDKEKDRHR